MDWCICSKVGREMWGALTNNLPSWHVSNNEDYVSSILQMSSGISIGFFNFVQHLNHINIIYSVLQNARRDTNSKLFAPKNAIRSSDTLELLIIPSGLHNICLAFAIFRCFSVPCKIIVDTGVWYSKSIRGPYPAHYCYKTVAR